MSHVKQGSTLPEGTFILEFKGYMLHGYATEISSDAQWRIAVHEFDRRRGGQTENMERGPRQEKITLCWVDSGGFEDATEFLLSLERNPSGLLVHPILGKMKATCSGFTGAHLSADQPNTWLMPVVFIEDNLDGSVVGEDGESPQALSQDVDGLVASILASIANYSLAVQASVSGFLNAATELASLASAAADAGTVDTGLSTAFGSVYSASQTAIADLQQSSDSDPEAGAVATSCEVLVDTCARLVRASTGAADSPEIWVAREDVSLVQVAQEWYGPDAISRLGEIEANNPSVSGLLLIPAGTKLLKVPAREEF